MKALTMKLKNWGTDTDGAIHRFVDDEEFYLSIVQKFCADDNYLKLKEALDNDDVEQAFFHSHTLKGVLGNLGLNPILAANTDVLEALRSGDIALAKEKYPKLEEVYKEFLQIIKSEE